MKTLALLTVLALCVVGCSGTNSDTAPDSTSHFEGKYIDVENPDDFLDFNDGKWFWRFEGEPLHGQYRLDGTNLSLLHALGQVVDVNVEGNTLILSKYFDNIDIAQRYVKEK